MSNNKDAQAMNEADFTYKDEYTMEDLVTLNRFLLSENGCPWLRSQTHESIRNNCIEEAYEVCDAISTGTPEKLCDELGDLLMQCVIHAAIAEEAGEFDMSDVIKALYEKQLKRNTHVFRTANKLPPLEENTKITAEDAVKAWNAAKASEKPSSVYEAIDLIPRSYSALERAYGIASVMQKAGLSPYPAFYKREAEAGRSLAETSLHKLKDADLSSSIIESEKIYNRINRKEREKMNRDLRGSLGGIAKRDLSEAIEDGIGRLNRKYQLDSAGLASSLEALYGDALFTLAIMAAEAGVDPEPALHDAIETAIAKLNPLASERKRKRKAGEEDPRDKIDDHSCFLPESAVNNLQIFEGIRPESADEYQIYGDFNYASLFHRRSSTGTRKLPYDRYAALSKYDNDDSSENAVYPHSVEEEAYEEDQKDIY